MDFEIQLQFLQILLIKAVCLARLQAREFDVATCVLKIFSKIFFLDFYK
jgi:hypothetical protein